jgi:solute carrier family 25 iron transporter 28/37
MTDGDIDLEWEEWRAEDISFIHHMVAGSLAGLAEHVTMFPIDTLKTHLQCERCINGSKPTQTFQCAANLIREKGVLRLWRGVGATFSGCVPGQQMKLSFILLCNDT